MNNTKAIQLINYRRMEYEELQDIIRDQTGVKCSVLVKPAVVSIRTRDYTDFVLAKAAIKGRVSKEIVRDIEKYL